MNSHKTFLCSQKMRAHGARRALTPGEPGGWGGMKPSRPRVASDSHPTLFRGRTNRPKRPSINNKYKSASADTQNGSMNVRSAWRLTFAANGMCDDFQNVKKKSNQHSDYSD